jgi:hypothetical protein
MNNEVNDLPDGWIGVLLYLNFLFIGWLFIYLRRNCKLVGFQLGMNISIVVGGMSAFTTGVLLVLQYPFYYTSITFISTFVGLLIGGVFGSLFDYQTVLTGYANGLMMGLMAPMVGSLIDDYIPFIIFIEMLLILSLSIVALSIRRS